MKHGNGIKPPRASSLERRFALVWRAVNGPDLVCEHRFDAVRKWRFDFAHVASKTAIELEGGIWNNGAHSRGRHFVSDCEKYNAAAAQGWAVFRLGTGMVRVPAAEAIAAAIKARLMAAGGATFRVGGYSMFKYEGHVYLMNPVGEGMETGEAKLEAAIARFFQC